MAPLISHVYEQGLIEAEASRRPSASPPACSSPAPRASSRHRSRPTPSRWPPRARPSGASETGEEKVILTALCGHGHLDLSAYDFCLYCPGWPVPRA
jgi:tryptophan synthase beta chain